ncbi:MAG TPA: hypothetical protein VGC41_12495, partial [Kofleriaceae bacterium]
VVKGALVVKERSFQFVPDAPWVAAKAYKMTLVSGSDSTCNANEICGISDAASFDVLSSMAGTGSSGGPDLVVRFTGAAPTGATYMLATTSPFTDVNGSGSVDGAEVTADDNRTVMHITNADDLPISSAKFASPSCEGGASGDGCLYIAGAMPVEMQPLMMGCTLPDGTSVASCMPVTIAPGIMYGTSVTMAAKIYGTFTLNSDTNTSIMRVREPTDGPVTGYIYDDNGTPTMISKLDLYMDAPDLKITGATHDLHSKAISIMLKGPVTFTADGRIAIALTNQADVPIAISIDVTILGHSEIDLILPQNQMKLQLLSAPLRGALP